MTSLSAREDGLSPPAGQPPLPSPSPSPTEPDPEPDLEALVSPSQNAARPALTPLPSAIADVLWRGDALGRTSTLTWSSGFPALDAELPGGGWPAQQITEVLQTQFSLAEWRLVGPALRTLVKRGTAVVLVGPPKRPHLPGLRHLGLDERHLVWIQAQAPSERLWCTEQLIKSNAAGAVMAWMPQAAPEQLRRLQVLAQSFEGPIFLFRPLEARHDPSPAPLRLQVTIDVDWALQVQILKRKGPAQETPLRLPSIPGGLDTVLTPRVMRPSHLRPQPATTPAPVRERVSTVQRPSRRSSVAVSPVSAVTASATASATVSATSTASSAVLSTTLSALVPTWQADHADHADATSARTVPDSSFPERHDVVGRPDPVASSTDAVR
ncbi:translesion DNA synthesis-associated protein ImuA [Roseateles amylovorans]|uniref:Translesion DNA synthesis-associated protein ImuA n=1 Tax=Roseateles amylovorans TaxID=2978473 RepID=A0ABY6B4E1_9BURK|nr:translesion DNA synthesis-associated protein ImuA [Roseateles amylovorans]UXH79712.1 translesion DNA synthesis-associated protein ImuA [Roseateles amylovorans]